MSRNFNKNLQNNILDEDFQNMLLPLNILKAVGLQTKYSINNGSITPKGVIGHIISFISIPLMAYVHISRYLTIRSSGYMTDSMIEIRSFLLAGAIFDGAFYIGSYIIFFFISIYHNQSNVELILKIQRSYKVVGESSYVKKFKLRNWFYVCAFVVTVTIWMLIGSFLYMNIIGFYLFIYSLLFMDINIIFVTRLIMFLVYEVEMWRVRIDKLKAACSKSDQIHRTDLSQISYMEKRLYEAYVDILEANALCGNIFKVPIHLLTLELVVHPLLYIQTAIVLGKTTSIFNNLTISLKWLLLNTILKAEAVCAILLPVIWVIKNFTLMSCYCAVNQQYSLAVAEADAACAVVLSKGKERLVNVHRLCKKVRRLNATRAAAGGALAADATLPLRLLALLATYTVVLLQFAFL